MSAISTIASTSWRHLSSANVRLIRTMTFLQCCPALPTRKEIQGKLKGLHWREFHGHCETELVADVRFYPGCLTHCERKAVLGKAAAGSHEKCARGRSAAANSVIIASALVHRGVRPRGSARMAPLSMI